MGALPPIEVWVIAMRITMQVPTKRCLCVEKEPNLPAFFGR